MIWMKCKRVEPLGLPFRLQSFLLNPEVSHPPIEVAAVNAHFFGGFGDIAVEFGEFVQDEFALICVGGVFEGWKAEARRRAFRR